MKKRLLLDTNVLVRFFMNDVTDQCEKAKKIVSDVEQKKAYGIISLTVIQELIWVLEDYYELKRADYIPLVLQLLHLKCMVFAEGKKQYVLDALTRMKKCALDFADVYLCIIAKQKNYEVVSFDKGIHSLLNKE